MRFRGVVVGVLVVVAACTPGDPMGRRGSGSSSSPAVSVTVRCDAAIGGEAAPSGELRVVGGAVALPVDGVRGRALQVAEVELPGGDRGLFAKQGLLVRRGQHVELTVPEDLYGRFWMEWGSQGPPGARVVVDRCRAEREWIVFAGGYTVREAGCVPVRVSVNGAAAQEVLIGVGAPCPGQRPPPAAAPAWAATL